MVFRRPIGQVFLTCVKHNALDIIGRVAHLVNFLCKSVNYLEGSQLMIGNYCLFIATLIERSDVNSTIQFSQGHKCEPQIKPFQ